MNRCIRWAVVLLFTVSWAEAQTTLSWAKDYIRDANGNAIAVATPQPTDQTAPSVPANLAAAPNSSSPETAIDLSWSGSSDTGGSGMAGYVIYRGAIPVGAVPNTSTGFTDLGLRPNTGYSYRVVAFDAAYNYSNYSSAESTSTNALSGSPKGLTASASSTSQIDLSWTNPASGAPDHYRIWRKSGGGWVDRGTTASTSSSDTGLSSNTTYVYKVAAEDSSNTVLGETNVDLATTLFFTDDTIAVGSTVIKAAHVTELRTGVNAVRAAAGLSAATWTNDSLSGAWIKAVDISEMRTALGDALNVLGLPAPNYTDSTLIDYSGQNPIGVLVKKAHIEELRQRVK